MLVTVALLSLLASATGLALSGRAHVQSTAINGRRSRPITCGWGPDPIWTPLTLASIEDAADGLKAITIEPPAETAETFTIPGQYLQIREPGAEKAGIFAIASSPDAVPFEFLIKETPPSDWSPGTGWLTGASAGLELEMSQVMGPGFKIAEHMNDVDRVLLFAAGSGISPIRSVIESGMLADKEVELYYGARTPAMMAYEDKLDAWAKLGINIQPCISAADMAAGKAEQGYVQDVAKAEGAFSKIPEKTAVLLCGMKGMAEGIKEYCAEAGIDEARVLANF
jgi:ferredoxin-NADP reductase